VSGAAGTPLPSGRFPSRFRVRKRPEFLSIQERGQRVSTPRFVLILSASIGADSPRLGITASRRVGNSVVRSRAKRLIREAFRATRELWPKGIDLVVIVKRAPGASTRQSRFASLANARGQSHTRGANAGARAHLSNSNLPADAVEDSAARLSLRAVVLALRRGMPAFAWRRARQLARGSAHLALPPIPPRRLRSSSHRKGLFVALRISASRAGPC
jgi:ribonuclease P protein component